MRFQHVLLLALAVPTLLGIAGCGNQEGDRLANKKPIVLIKGGPIENSVASYTARILWSGWDEDGVITHYEYALDPPAAFTAQEIADPEHSANLTLRILPGAPTFQDTLVYSKVDDTSGEQVSYRWVQTREFGRAFAFETAHPDSENVGGTPFPKEQFSGYHVIYVRCQDNDGDYSDKDPITKDILDADYVGYTATTQTPHSNILRPSVAQDIIDLGSTVSVQWDGIDADSPAADKKPKGYIYNLLRLDNQDPPIPILGAGADLLYYLGEWIYQDGDTTQHVFQLSVPGTYMFGVRAVDVAGAVEPKVAFGRNAFKFQAFAGGGNPALTIRESSTGAFSYVGIGLEQEAEVPAGTKLRFNWTATAEEYGGTIEAFSWGVDIPDLNQEGPESGWSGWGMVTTTGDIVFRGGGIHVLYVRVRDVAGSVTLGSLVLNVVEFEFDREVLMVDDYKDSIFPTDAQHDQFWRDMISYYVGNSNLTTDQFFTWPIFGPDDRSSNPNAPKLSELGRYKLLVWDNLGSGYGGHSGLLQVAAVTPKLRTYLAGGGKLWLSGQYTIAATMATGSGSVGDFSYPKTQLGPGDFAYDFLKLHTAKLNNDKNAWEGNLFNRAKTYPGFPVYYDTLIVDLNKLNLGLSTLGGVPFADAVFEPIYAETEPDFRGNIDSLYVYGAAGNEFQGQTSSYQNRLCGLRWSDLDPDRAHGRIQWFGFPMYFIRNNQAEVVFKKSLDWFREEEPTVSP